MSASSRSMRSRGGMASRRFAIALRANCRKARSAASFYKILPGEIVVIHDEIDLRPGKLRVKKGGGSAGHNGLRSIDALLGSDYWRVRIGVGHPGVKELVQPYVLQNFPGEEIKEWVGPLLDAVAETIPLLLADDAPAFMSEVARRFTPPEPPGPDDEAAP